MTAGGLRDRDPLFHDIYLLISITQYKYELSP